MHTAAGIDEVGVQDALSFKDDEEVVIAGVGGVRGAGPRIAAAVQAEVRGLQSFRQVGSGKRDASSRPKPAARQDHSP